MKKIRDSIRAEILKFLYNKEYNKQLNIHSPFVVKASMVATQESQLEYESLSFEEKRLIYQKIIDSKIKKYLISSLEDSMCMYWVNGCPAKRLMRIKEYAHHKFNQMNSLEKAAICEILNLKVI
jgi:hypothetical protein